VPETVRLEICCGSLEDALAAQQGGADRIELCAALCVGGVTPSLGTILEAKDRVEVPVMAMIRPRAAGFHYRDPELAVMERDVEAALQAGAEGVVFGALLADGSVDVPACRRLRGAARDREVVFHRAFDVTPDPFRALEQLIELGFTRVLTSGQSESALLGATTLRRLVAQAGDRIEILAGGGIRAHNVQEIVHATGCRQVHLSAFGTASDPSTAARPDLGFLADHLPPGQYPRTDPAKVREVARVLRAAPPLPLGPRG
jgi:copper homeostasis protein